MPGENFIDGSGDTPVSWWMFEDASSPALDGSANNNDLTWGTSGSRSTTHQQGSFAIQGSVGDGIVAQRAIASLSVGFPATLSPTAGFTFGGWFYATVYHPGNPVEQFIQTLDAIATGGWAIQTFSNLLEFNGTGGVIISNDILSLNRWTHIVIRYNGDNRSGAGVDNEQSLWINGVKQSTTFTPATWNLATVNPLTWFYNSDGSFFYDEWFAFNVALLDTQIADLWRYGLSGEDNHSPWVVRPELSLFPKPSIAEANLRGEM